jgi:hypothetical protein
LGYRLARSGVLRRRGCLVVSEDFFGFMSEFTLEISFEFEIDAVYLSHDVLHLVDGRMLHDG